MSELTGPITRALRKSLQEAFTREDFEVLLREGTPPRELRDLVPPGSFEHELSGVIQCALRDDWIRDLLGAVGQARPRSASLMNAIGLCDEALSITPEHGRPLRVPALTLETKLPVNLLITLGVDRTATVGIVVGGDDERLLRDLGAVEQLIAACDPEGAMAGGGGRAR